MRSNGTFRFVNFIRSMFQCAIFHSIAGHHHRIVVVLLSKLWYLSKVCAQFTIQKWMDFDLFSPILSLFFGAKFSFLYHTLFFALALLSDWYQIEKLVVVTAIILYTLFIASLFATQIYINSIHDVNGSFLQFKKKSCRYFVEDGIEFYTFEWIPSRCCLVIQLSVRLSKFKLISCFTA